MQEAFDGIFPWHRKAWPTSCLWRDLSQVSGNSGTIVKASTYIVNIQSTYVYESVFWGRLHGCWRYCCMCISNTAWLLRGPSKGTEEISVTAVSVVSKFLFYYFAHLSTRYRLLRRLVCGRELIFTDKRKKALTKSKRAKFHWYLTISSHINAMSVKLCPWSLFPDHQMYTI